MANNRFYLCGIDDNGVPKVAVKLAKTNIGTGIPDYWMSSIADGLEEFFHACNEHQYCIAIMDDAGYPMPYFFPISYEMDIDDLSKEDLSIRKKIYGKDYGDVSYWEATR